MPPTAGQTKTANYQQEHNNYEDNGVLKVHRNYQLGLHTKKIPYKNKAK